MTVRGKEGHTKKKEKKEKKQGPSNPRLKLGGADPGARMGMNRKGDCTAHRGKGAISGTIKIEPGSAIESIDSYRGAKKGGVQERNCRKAASNSDGNAGAMLKGQRNHHRTSGRKDQKNRMSHRNKRRQRRAALPKDEEGKIVH